MSDWTSGFVDSNDIRLHYNRTGGDKPPVVLCHGITDSGLCWTPVAQVLEANYDVVMVDARGHGQSSTPVSGYTRADHAADVADLIDLLGLDRPALVGHSMGAGVAAVVAAKYPQMVSRIVLEDPPWRMGQQSQEERMAARAQWQRDIKAHQSKSDEELLAFVRQRSPTWGEGELSPWVVAKKSVSPAVLNFIDDEHRWQDDVDEITCPVLLVRADPELGAIVGPETVEYVTGKNDNIQVVHIPGAGHNIRREQFNAYIAAVIAFLAATAAA
jgi:N-formylmaleamate deformylase